MKGCLAGDTLSLSRVVGYAENKVHGWGFHGAGFWVFRGNVLTATSGSWKVLIVSSVPLVEGLDHQVETTMGPENSLARLTTETRLQGNFVAKGTYTMERVQTHQGAACLPQPSKEIHAHTSPCLNQPRVPQSVLLFPVSRERHTQSLLQWS